jgi:DNA-binding CsgD family transcriptional regulator
MPTARVSLESVFRHCLGSNARDLTALRGTLAVGSTHARLVDAVLAQFDGDVARGDRILRNAWQSASSDECGFVADLWLPIVISLQRFEEVETILGDPRVDRDAMTFAALRSVVAAIAGDAAASLALASSLEAGLDDEADPLLRMRVHQRLALAAFYRKEPETALRHADASVALARANGAHRIAAGAHSVAYTTHYALTGDLLAALRCAREVAVEAGAAGDRSVRALGLVAQYEISVELADDAAARATMELLRAEPLPEQYRERFASRVADAMTQAANADYAAARNVFVVLSDEDGRSQGERSLCRALAALCNVAVGDDDAARTLSRRAIGASARPPSGLPVYELRYRRLARAIACATCALLGDTVRADRRADAALLRDDPDVAGLVGAGRGVRAASLSPKVRGYARLIESVHARLTQRPGSGPLTTTELEIFRQIDAGRNAPQIAEALGRSPYTIRTHVRNAIEKLQARGRLDALARARKMGLLQDA